MKNNLIKKQCGYTMLELTIGVTVVALVMAGVVSAGRKLSQNIAFDQFNAEMEGGMSALKALTKRQASTAGITNTSVAMTGVFSGFTLSGGRLVSSSVGLGMDIIGSNDWRTQGFDPNQVIQVNLTRYDREKCLNLLNTLHSNAVLAATSRDGRNVTTVLKNSIRGTTFNIGSAAAACDLNPAAIIFLYDRI